MIKALTFLQNKILFILIVILFLTILCSLYIGAYPMTISHTSDVLLNILRVKNDYIDLKEIAVLEYIRPSRIFVATFCGITLSISGAALQGMMRNPLVEPNFVGVTAGAAFGGVLAIVFSFSQIWVIIFAFIGGLSAMSFTFGLAKMMNLKSDGIALILAGFFVGSFFLACVGFLEFVNRNGSLPGIVYWLLGTFRGADLNKVMLIGTSTFIGGTILILLRWRINLLSLGDVDAASLGINTNRLRWVIIIVVSFMIAAQVSVSGIIGWVGLVIPHLARMLVGPDHCKLLPVSAILGGIFVLSLDDFTRAMIRGEIPVGVLCAFVGTPIVCFLLWKTQTKGWNKS